MKNITTLIMITMMPIALFAQKDVPDSMKVSDHKGLIAKYAEKFAEDGLKSPKVKKIDEDVEKLTKPLALNDQVELRVKTRRGGFAMLKGRFYSVDARRVRIGDREYPQNTFEPIDWLRMQAAAKPDILKKTIADKGIEKKAEIKRFIHNKTASSLITDGYSRNFLKNVVVIGTDVPHYVLKKNAGDRTFIVGVFKYGSGGKHMEKFVKVVVDYKGNLPLAFVLVVDNPDKKGNPLIPCRFGTLDPTKKITEAPFKTRSFYLSKAQLKKELGDKWEKVMMENMRVVILKRKGLWDGIWGLERDKFIPIGARARPRPLDCPDCWGKKHVSLAIAVDIRKEVEAVLKEAHASPEIKKSGEALIRKFATEKEDDADAKKEACPTCEGKGAVGYGRATGGIIVFKLNEKSIASYKKKLPEFVKLYNSVVPTDAVRKLREQIAGTFAKKTT